MIQALSTLSRRNLQTQLGLPLTPIPASRERMGVFGKRWRHDNHVISLTEFSANSNPNWPLIAAFSNLSRVVWTENFWCAFKVKTLFLNYLWVVWTRPLSSCVIINLKNEHISLVASGSSVSRQLCWWYDPACALMAAEKLRSLIIGLTHAACCQRGTKRICTVLLLGCKHQRLFRFSQAFYLSGVASLPLISRRTEKNKSQGFL